MLTKETTGVNPPARWEEVSRLLDQAGQCIAQAKSAALQLRQRELRAETAGPAVTQGQRHLVYVHGICKHLAHFSDKWWNSLHPFTNAFEDGMLDGTRHEVLWSDVVGDTNLVARSAVAASPESAEWAARVRGVLEDRAATHATNRMPSITTPELKLDVAARQLTGRDAFGQDQSAALGLQIPGISCVNDFRVYMFNDTIRAQVLGRFTGVVRPLLEAGAELDIISHSWGTVVAYEGLRELEDAGLTSPDVRNFFTVGAALSIFLVKMRLRPANRDGHRPALVKRWINLNAHGDPVGGQMQGRPYQVDAEFLDIPNLGCSFFDASCAHGSYFQPDNTFVNQDVFGSFINRE